MKWHDGQTFMADDVIFPLMKFHMEMSPRGRAILRKVMDAKAPDAQEP